MKRGWIKSIENRQPNVTIEHQHCLIPIVHYTHISTKNVSSEQHRTEIVEVQVEQ